MTDRIRGYHRPSDVQEALDLLFRPDIDTKPLGGGTVLNTRTVRAEEVVDLQDLGLEGISVDGTRMTIGGTCTLQEIVDHPQTSPTIARLAQAELPNTLRNAATIGGTVATGDAESGLLAGLLAFGAEVTVLSHEGTSVRSLEDALSHLPIRGLITAVTYDTAGRGAASGTGRTPADTPIVLVAGCRRGDGSLTLAATGVASTPVVLGEPVVDPPGDFRGSPDYRRHLCQVHRERVVARLQGGAS